MEVWYISGELKFDCEVQAETERAAKLLVNKELWLTSGKEPEVEINSYQVTKMEIV